MIEINWEKVFLGIKIGLSLAGVVIVLGLIVSLPILAREAEKKYKPCTVEKIDCREFCANDSGSIAECLSRCDLKEEVCRDKVSNNL